MTRLKLIVPAVILVGGLVAPATVSFAKPDAAKKEGVKCMVCHSKGKELNKVGECYKAKKDLKACQAQ